MLYHRSALASRVCGAGSYLRSRAPSLNLVRTTVVQPFTVPFLRRMVLHSSSLHTSQHLGRHSSRHGSQRPRLSSCPPASNGAVQPSRAALPAAAYQHIRMSECSPPTAVATAVAIRCGHGLAIRDSLRQNWGRNSVFRAELGRNSGGSGAGLNFFRHRCSHWLRFHGLLVSQCVRARSGEFSLHIPRTCASARIQDDPIMLQVVDCIISACRPLQLRVSRDAFGFRPDVRA